MISWQDVAKFIKQTHDDADLQGRHRFSIPEDLLALLAVKYGIDWHEKIKNKTIKIPHCPLSLCVEHERYLTTDFDDNFLNNTFLNLEPNDMQYYLKQNSKQQIFQDIQKINNKANKSSKLLKIVAVYMGYKIIQTETKFFNEAANKALNIDLNVDDFTDKPIYKYKPNKSNKHYDKFFSDVDEWAEHNVKLIKNVKSDTAAKVKDIVVGAFKAGDIRSKELVDDLMQATNCSRKRVTTIARDQVSKLYGQRNKAQALALGLRRYKWRTCLDERVRDTHRDKEGKVYLFDEDINPGEEVNCRCVAETLVDW